MAASETLVIETLDRLKQLKERKHPWENQWQLLGEYIHMRKQEFNSEHEEGDFLNDLIFDATGPRAVKTAASSLLSMLWPQTRNKLKIRPPRGVDETPDVKEYYEFVTETILDVFEDPRAGLAVALDEYMVDDLVFGTAGIEIQSDPKTGVKFSPWGVKHMTIDEGPDGVVDTVYLETNRTVSRVVRKYGIDSVSEETRKLFNAKQFNKKVRILQAIEPRIMRDVNSRSNKEMPFQSLHIEVKAKKLLREKGFEDFPIPVNRFSKIQKELYGRSLGMDALPDILELNVVREATTIAIEKMLDPPLAVLDDSKLGNGEIDTSAGAINTFNISGRAGERDPIFPLFTVGEIRQAAALIEVLTESVANHFLIDRLLDFNNETRMTLGEAQIRNRLRNATLGSIFSRQISETFSPIVRRTFNVLFAKNQLGVIAGTVDEIIERDINGREPVIIPEVIAERMLAGEDVFRIEYFTPALRIMQAEETEGILRTFELEVQQAQIVPEISDNINHDFGIKRFMELSGAPSEMANADTLVKSIRKDRAAAQAAAQEQEQLLRQSETLRNIGNAGLIPQPQQQAA